MRKTNYFKLFILAIICCLSTNAFAQTLVGDFASFDAAFTSMKTSGGGTIQLTAPITIQLAAQTSYNLSTDASNPIEIDTQQFSIIVSGTNATADSTILKIGDNMNIHGTSTVLANLNRGIIRITGGTISSTTTVSGTSTVYANSGWIFISGGTISMNATGVANAYAVNVINNFALVLRGGTISAIGDNTRALSLTDGVTPTPIYNATITANGIGAYGIQSLGGNSLTIGDNISITTTSTNSTDAALVGGGSTSKIIIPATVSNLTLTSSIKYKLDNAGSAVIDLRNLTLTASPVDGSSLTYPSNNVTLTASGNESSATCGIYYGFTVAPTSASPNIASGASVAATSATTVLKASFGKNGFIDTNVFTFNYTVSGLPANLPVDVSTIADFQTAFTNSQTGTPRTTTINLLANLTTSGAYSFVADPNYPVIITANTFYIKTGSSGTWGGSLSASNSSTSGVGIFQISGAYTTNFTGGTYTGNNNQGLIYSNSGQGVDNTLTKLYLSNATFTVNGTTNGVSVIKFATSNGNLISATNCSFNINAKGIAFNLVGPQDIILKNSTITVNGSDASSQIISFAPTQAGFVQCSQTLDNVTITMSSGTILTTGGSKPINTIIMGLTLNGNALATLTAPIGGTGVKKFYDFRAYTPTVDITPGSYLLQQTVTPSLTTTTVLPVDAANATMVYTLDGTDPIAASTAYTAPIVISTSKTLKVAAIKDGFVGKPTTFTYTIGSTAVQNPDNYSVSVYPTTVSSILNISKTADFVNVYDLAGKSVISKNNVKQLDLSSIHSGVYFVKVSLNNSSKTFKIVKE